MCSSCELGFTTWGLGSKAYSPPEVDRIWVPLKGLYRDYMGIMEKKMETII